ncbi:MAG TPA: hypothetical protein VGS97_23995 [Actinocrinis sp.]|uniref:hypothetical protein n=1 Tax=Actinocrinis sp. TaxID=1920516 RepID=UPI002DDDB22C|nr:hypothetical protein [Actinocrinis sp.]HEV2347180.1 hypothetical protein [Actinocrinis sp.]
MLGVPRGTIGAWKFNDRQRYPDAYPPTPWNSCPACHSFEVNEQPYSYLLGLYLGDGHIVHKHKQHTLSISCADAWPGLIDAAEAAMRDVMPGVTTSRVQRTGCTDVKSYSEHWICMFPQHGPGRKHERPIVLEEWQEFVLDAYPEEFIRGLIHSDGCRVMNWTTRTVAGTSKRYDYPRYHFTNESEDIRNLFKDTLDALGIEWRYNKRNTISVARRESVAALDEFVGPKY